MAVLGVSASGARFLLDGVRHRMTLSQRWIMMRDLYKKWSRAKGIQHVSVGYERYGMQSDDEYFREQMEIEAKRGEACFFHIAELNWTRDNQNSKTERVERLEPDFRNGRFYLPRQIVWEGRPAVWWVDQEPESKTFGTVIKNRPDGVSKILLQAVQDGAGDLIAQAIKRKDQDGRLYDVTLGFIEEYLYFPWGRYKDLIDATSRIYDMQPRGPVIVGPDKTEPVIYFDGV
jgi:hypothetical protein